jgi:hypothetical protein
MTDNDFIEFINDIEPAITICGITFSPGDILKEMDPIAFRVFKSDYEADMEEDEDENLSIQIDEYSHINEN